MIKVASLWKNRAPGSSHRPAELVYQLRKKGIRPTSTRQTESGRGLFGLIASGPRSRTQNVPTCMIPFLAGTTELKRPSRIQGPTVGGWQQTLKYIKDKKKFNPEMTVAWKGIDFPVPLAMKRHSWSRIRLLPP